jgi:hypothetical protein
MSMHPAAYGFQPRPTPPLVYRVAQVDAALARCAVHLREARLSGNPAQYRAVITGTDRLLDTRLDLMKEKP